jgi:hypothetical protein
MIRKHEPEPLSAALFIVPTSTFFAACSLVFICALVSFLFEGDMLREPSVVANLLTFYILGLLTHVRVDASGHLLSASEHEYRTDLGIAVAVLTIGIAAMEIARNVSGIETTLSFMSNLIWAGGAFLLAFGALVFLREDLSFISSSADKKSLARRYSWAFFLASASLLSLYSGLVLMSYGGIPLTEMGSIEEMLSQGLNLAVTLMGMSLVQRTTRQFKLAELSPSPGVGKYGRAFFLLLLPIPVLILLFFFAQWVPVDRLATTLREMCERDDETSPPAVLNGAVSWPYEAFQTNDDEKLESSASLFETPLPGDLLDRYCASEVLVVAGGASATGSRVRGEELSLARAKNLLARLQEIFGQSDCGSNVPKFYLLHLGQYQMENEVDNVDQRRPLVIFLSRDSSQLALSEKDVTAGVVSAIAREQVKGNFAEICFDSYSRREIWEYSRPLDVGRRTTIDFDDSSACVPNG